ncbi:MAG: hypothetical protein WC975_03885 [Phycisphaerae bacterium]
MKYFAVIVILGVGLTSLLLNGCTALDLVKNQGSLCLLINCESVGIVDAAGQHNSLAPSSPNYGDDPTCTLPGMCGPSIYYPYSTATTTTTTQ